jgi:UDP-N-acetyl-D-glucosamine/UDP-N-acetyl-D-galactosamine dehydrogenase
MSITIEMSAKRLAVLGLGYVGLPLAVEFAKFHKVIGFDINTTRIGELQKGYDATKEVSANELAEAQGLTLTSDLEDLRDCRVFIVTVPTPIDANKRPDLTPLMKASKTVGTVLKRGDLVVYESTVYPGATEEDCVPVLEQISGLQMNVDFHVGYSPERINPGDKHHRLVDIQKVTSGSSPEAAEFINSLYGSIITAGTHKAESIRVAEAAKVIENTQRDLNIALMNELSILFERLGIDTEAVIRAASTKWNFLPFRPGLVGGHCIGVDPYYLTHKAEAVGYHPQLILAGRRINDGMGRYVASTLIKKIMQRGLPIRGGRVLVLGLTFKENCPDLRNTRVIDVIEELREFGVTVDVADPQADADEAQLEYDIKLITPKKGVYEAIILAVPHREFVDQGAEALRAFGKVDHVFYDMKAVYPAAASDLRL